MINTCRQLRKQRRAIVAAFYAVIAAGVGVALAATPPTRPATTRGPATAPTGAKAAAEAQFLKAKALYDDGKYAEAQAENEKALALDPTHENAQLLRRVLANKVSGESAAATTSGPAGTPGRFPLLNQQQISTIRLLELGPDDRAITGTIDPKTVEDFWQNVVVKDPLQTDKSRAAHDAFIKPANFTNQALRIRDSHDHKYMDQLKINSDPAVIISFRQNVSTYVLQNCATAECHGGDKGGNFRLSPTATSPEQLYTNFYILSMYTSAQGKMIDRDTPAKSLLVQFGLPWSTATAKHPKVDVKRLSGIQDARYRTLTDWVRTLGLVRPNYGIAYEMPGARATPASASAPASAPATTTAPATAPSPK